jgi:hypothetical protein
MGAGQIPAVVLDAFTAEIVRPPAKVAQLAARIDGSSGFLVLESELPMEWPRGGTIDALVTLDLASDGTLAHAEVMSPRSRWPRGVIELSGVKQTGGTLRLPLFSSETVPQLQRVSVLASDSCVLIRFAELGTVDRIPIGKDVDALVEKGSLKGLLVATESLGQ